MDNSCVAYVDYHGEDQESHPDNKRTECLEIDESSIYATPPLTPMSSCYWSCFSSFDDLPEYLNAESREENIHYLVDQNCENEGSTNQLLEYDVARSTGEIDSETLHVNKSVIECGSHLKARTNLLTDPLLVDHKVSNTTEDGKVSTLTLKNNSSFPSLELRKHEDEVKIELNNDKLDSFQSVITSDDSDVEATTSLADIPFLPNCEADTAIHMPPEPKDFNDIVEDKDNINDLDINRRGQNEGHIKHLLEHDVAESIGEINIDHFHNTSDNGPGSYLAAETYSSSNALLLDETSVCDGVSNREDEYESEMKLKKILSSTSSEQNFCKNEGKYELSHGSFGSFEIRDTCDESDVEDVNSLERSSFLPNFETDPTIWMPPEPENLEDEIGCVANNDDDNYGDGTVWAQPSSLHSLNGKTGKAHKYIEDRHKAMIARINGQFRILARHLLVSEGISFSATDDSPSWLDIVVLLSWEAAQFVKPDANEGLAMDPSLYVKVKCAASGSRHDSQVIKGLVFKKSAAHKHMATNLKNPKLLLLQGTLGHSLVGFSSFKSMDQENDQLTSFTEMIATCHPDVVMVEKTVSRDVQESLLAEGITLVFEMKIHRLERIARCIGSPIISAAGFPKLMKLNQCESFHIEKIVEEHNQSEGGKKPSKTLMFLEGFPKPLGCTILLKGAHSDVLKKIKHVVHYTVFAAYHLILETSFLADHKVFFAEEYETEAFSDKSSAVNCNARDSSETIEGSATSLVAQDVLHSPTISHGSAKPFLEKGISLQSYLHVKGPQTFPRYDSVNSSFGNSFAHQFCNACKSDTSDYHGSTPFFGFNDKLINKQSMGLCTLLPNSFNHEDKLNHNLNEEKSIFHAKALLETDPSIASVCTTQDANRIQSLLVQQSILVLQSRHCITKQVICEESHLSRIKYYGNYDVSLERFLKDTLLNKMYKCSSCEEPTEAHVFSYTHKNGNLSVLVRQLPQGLHLLGEDEGKIWMWIRCLKCRNESGIHTRRVLLSGSALKLSFGKFLEINFSVHSASIRLNKCGHSLLRDSLRFFGSGFKVAMFKYSPIKIYAPCKPPPVLEFHSVKGQQWLKKEIESILAKSSTFFTEVSKMMENLSNEKIQFPGSFKGYSEIKGMLTNERIEFEDSLLKAIGQNCETGMTVSQFLGLRWINQELRLHLYIWDQRIKYLLHSGVNKGKNGHQKHVNTNVDDVNIGDPLFVSTAKHCAEDMEIVSAEISKDDDSSSHHPIVVLQGLGHASEEFSGRSKIEENASDMAKQNCDGKQSYLLLRTGSSKIRENEDPVFGEAFLGKESDLQIKTNKVDDATKNPSVHDASTLDLFPSISGTKYGPITEDMQKLCWLPLSELRRELKKDLIGGSLRKFEFINTYTPSYLSPINQPSSYQIDSLHFVVGPGETVMTASEDEISSIIACALAFSDQQGAMDMIDKETVGIIRSIHAPACSISDYSVLSASWSSSRYAESEGSRSFSSSSSDKSSTLCSDGLLSTDEFLSSYNLHPETAMGLAGKSKFSVVCIYAKEFYKFRRKCCPSELAYISSLSRCKKWDAQGGKSKAFFAKTMDDRFILKQIKKAELESFIKFGPEYFKHVSHSLESGSQTCLAKILGIYQVKQNKSGKELKLDLLVMENLMFGHSISRIYDLKGAMFSRYVAPNSGEVLLDQNFVEDMRVSPIYICGKAKHILERAIWNDTSFLTSVNVMDYSLLVGVDKQRHELVFGIIDYLREYTWDKQLETWVKASIVVPKNELPTVISPKEYKRRFRKFMSKYFLTVPDSWNYEQFPVHCKFCTNSKYSCAKVHSVELSEQSTRHANELH